MRPRDMPRMAPGVCRQIRSHREHHDEPLVRWKPALPRHRGPDHPALRDFRRGQGRQPDDRPDERSIARILLRRDGEPRRRPEGDRGSQRQGLRWPLAAGRCRRGAPPRRWPTRLRRGWGWRGWRGWSRRAQQRPPRWRTLVSPAIAELVPAVSTTLGEAWARDVAEALRAQTRELVGAWPGTMREARSRVLVSLPPRRRSAIDAAELESLSRAV